MTHNHDEQELIFPIPFPVDAINDEMNNSLASDIGEQLLVSNISSNTSLNHGTGIKNKKKKATAASPATSKQKKCAKRNEDLKDRPKRALSAYNFFFSSERNKLLRERPVRSIGKPLRSHGKVGFVEMATVIGAKWRNLNPEDKLYYEVMAANDKWRHNTEVAEWTQNRLEKKSQATTAAAAAQAAAAVVRPAVPPFHPKYNGLYSPNTALSSFCDNTPVLEPMMMSSATSTTTTVMQHREGGNASEAASRDYLLRLQQASFSTLAAPRAIAGVVTNDDANDLSTNAQLLQTTTTVRRQSYNEARNTMALTTTMVGNMYNLSSCSNYLDDNTMFDPIPLADTPSSCHNATTPHHQNGVTTASSSSYVHRCLALNMDEDCVDLQNNQAALAHSPRCQQQQQQQQQSYHHTQHQAFPTYHQ
jgi:HMG-box domain